jgi:hypothetical protein
MASWAGKLGELRRRGSVAHHGVGDVEANAEVIS